MTCPQCQRRIPAQHSETFKTKGGEIVSRRRPCHHCGVVYVTHAEEKIVAKYKLMPHLAKKPM
jgi:transcriptional regulator NrdR family protein